MPQNCLQGQLNDNLEAAIDSFFREKFTEYLREDMRNHPDYVRLSSFIKIKHGFAFDGDYFSETPTVLVLVSPGNFKIGGGFQNIKPKYYAENAPYSQDFVLTATNLVVTMTDLSKNGDTLGFSAVIPHSNTLTFLHNQRIGLIEFISEDLPPSFVYLLMRSDNYRNYILATASGTTVRHTSPSRITDYGFLMPSNKDELDILDNLFATYISNSNQYHSEFDLLAEVQATLMSRLAT